MILVITKNVMLLKKTTVGSPLTMLLNTRGRVTTSLLMCICEQVHRTSGLWYSAEYSTFSISDEVGKYQLTVAEYSDPTSDTKLSYYWHVIIRVAVVLT